MRDFDYAAPTALADAVSLLEQHRGRARCLAGGTDLIDHVRQGRLTPDLVIDVKKLAELNICELGSTGLRLGAAVPCRSISQHPQIARQYAALTDSSQIIGGVQIQSRASFGGNLCNSGPAADSSPSIIALGGVCVIMGPAGKREVPAEQFCTGPGKNILQPGELLVELRFPLPPENSGSHYRRFIPRNEMDIAVVGVAAAVTLDKSGQTFQQARVVLGAVAPTPLFVPAIGEFLQGQPVTTETLQKAGEIARDSIQPISDMRGPAEYRKHLAMVLTQRVIEAAVTRARGETLDYRPGH